MFLDAVDAPEDAGSISVTTMGTADKYTVFFTGTAFEAEFDSFSTEPDVTIPANEYTEGTPGEPLAVVPLQLHFHSLSEHTFDGYNAPAELHIVTKVKPGQTNRCTDDDPCLAVFGVMITFEGEGDKALKAVEQIFVDVPTGTGKENGFVKQQNLNIDDFLPNNLDHYTYLGSLTTPPCSEIVTWHVFKEPVAISNELVRAHQGLVAFTEGPDCTFVLKGVCFPAREKTNHREIQPLFGRTVYSVPMTS